MGPRTRGGDGGTDPGRAEQVDLDRLGQGGVEGDGGGGVDDHVAGGQGGPALVIEPQPVLPDVARHGPDPAGHLGGESIAQLGPQAVEAVVLDHLAGQPGGGIGPAARSNQHHDLGLRNAAQDAFDQRSAQKPGGTGDEKALSAEVPADGHSGMFSIQRRICLPFGK